MPVCTLVEDLQYAFCTKLIQDHESRECGIDTYDNYKPKIKNGSPGRKGKEEVSDSDEQPKIKFEYSFMKEFNVATDKTNTSLCRHAYLEALSIDKNMRKKLMEDRKFDVNNMKVAAPVVRKLVKKRTTLSIL